MTGNDLHTYRLDRNLTQSAIASTLGLTTRTISRYENNKSKIPKVISDLLKLLDRSETPKI